MTNRPQTPNQIFNELVAHYSLWRKALHNGHSTETQETKLILEYCKRLGVQSVLDIGGGIGVHAGTLSKTGYAVTILDKSEQALKIAKQKYPGITTKSGDFKDIPLTSSFDAAICMWSTMNYLINPKHQHSFFKWISGHTRKLIILDQSNYGIYPVTQTAHHTAQDKNTRMHIKRSWHIDHESIRTTELTYTITNMNTEDTQVFQDFEVHRFIPLVDIIRLLGRRWKLAHVLGDYDTRTGFNPTKSKRLITIFIRND